MFSIPPSIVGRPHAKYFPLCRKKIPPMLFIGATRPKSSKSQLTQGGSPRTPRKILSRCAVRKSPLYFLQGRPAPSLPNSNLLKAGRPEPHTKKIHSHYNTGAYVKNQIKFSLPLRELLRFLRQKPCVRGLFRRIS